MIPPAVDPAVLTLDAGGAVLIAAGIQFAATVVAATVAIYFGSSYRQQSRLAREQTRSRIHTEALQTIHDYIEAPYRVRRRDGSAAARMELTNRISDIQLRLKYYEDLLRLESTKQVADSYAAATAAARQEAGSAITKAWRIRPTKRDRDVPIRQRIPMPETDLLIAETRNAMRAGGTAG
jgi:hypothetical protein